MDDVRLRADCTRCSGLCCVALSFDRSPDFAFDKPAGIPCRHLSKSHRCGIHAELDARGLSGCRRYDCLGAGQRVTQEVFPGRSWRDSPAAARAIFTAFRILRDVHGLLALLEAAAHLALPPEAAAGRSRLVAALDPDPRWSFAALLVFDRGTLAAETRQFIASLRPHIRSPTDTRA